MLCVSAYAQPAPTPSTAELIAAVKAAADAQKAASDALKARRAALVVEIASIDAALGPVIPPTPPSDRVQKITALFSQLPDFPGRSADAGKLADVYSSVADQIKSGSLTTADAISAATTTATRAALGANIGQWRAFIAGPWTQFVEANQPAAVADYAPLWSDLAAGLRSLTVQQRGRR